MITDKKNDFFATVMFQPDATLEDLYTHDITPDNTKIESLDYYKSIPAVIETFSLEDGSLDESALTNFYNNTLAVYNAFSNSNFEQLIIDQFEYDPYD
jgi:hypothetical protein